MHTYVRIHCTQIVLQYKSSSGFPGHLHCCRQCRARLKSCCGFLPCVEWIVAMGTLSSSGVFYVIIHTSWVTFLCVSSIMLKASILNACLNPETCGFQLVKGLFWCKHSPCPKCPHTSRSPRFGNIMPDRLLGNNPLMQALQNYPSKTHKKWDTLWSSQMQLGQGHNSCKDIKWPSIPLD